MRTPFVFLSRSSDFAEDAKELVKSTTADLKLLKRIDGGSATENVRARALREEKCALSAAT